MAAAQQAYAAASDGRNLIADIHDGALLKAKPLKGFARFLAKTLTTFASVLVTVLVNKIKAGLGTDEGDIETTLAERFAWMDKMQEFPLAFMYDIRYDNYPTLGKRYKLVGGPWDGKYWTCGKEQQKKVKFTDGSWYEWDGYNVVYVQPLEAGEPEDE